MATFLGIVVVIAIAIATFRAMSARIAPRAEPRHSHYYPNPGTGAEGLSFGGDGGGADCGGGDGGGGCDGGGGGGGD